MTNAKMAKALLEKDESITWDDLVPFSMVDDPDELAYRWRLAFARPWTRPILKLLHRMGMM